MDNQNIAIFAGAGFSKFFLDLPLVKDLFDFNISEARSRDNEWLIKIILQKQDRDKNNSYQNNELFIADVMKLQNHLIKITLSPA